jgi:hypothetical protein
MSEVEAAAGASEDIHTEQIAGAGLLRSYPDHLEVSGEQWAHGQFRDADQFVGGFGDRAIRGPVCEVSGNAFTAFTTTSAAAIVAACRRRFSG